MNRETNKLLDVGRERTLRTLKHCLERAAVLTAAALTSVALTSAPLAAADSAPTTAPSSEIRDVILMLDNGPLHLRVHVAVGGMSPQEARRASLDRLVKSLDADGDGKLSQKEAERSPLFREKQRPKAEAFLKDIGVAAAFSRKDMEQRFERLGGETVVYRQNASSSESDNAVFKLLDANKDGVVDAIEMQDSVDLLLAKDADDDECVTLDEFAPPPTTNADQIAVAMNQPRPATSTVADLLRDTNQTLLPAEMLRKFDKDRNRKLSPEELSWTKERVATCDTDKDGQLNLKELGGLKNSPVDIELSVDVIRKEGQSMLKTLGAVVNRTDNDRSPASPRSACRPLSSPSRRARSIRLRHQ